jgi:hypothetical protein
MTKNIIIKNRRLWINRKSIYKKNTTILATYYALYAENKHLDKALLTITIGDENIANMKTLRKKFIAKLNSVLRKKAYKDSKLAYFTNIEFGADQGNLSMGLLKFNPHLHIQFFYEDIGPITEAVEYIENTYKLNNCCLTLPEKSNEEVNFDYVVKEYKYKRFNPDLELNKKKYSYGKALHTSSRKSITNYLIKYLYSYLSQHLSTHWNKLKSYERYEYILANIKDGYIHITTKLNRPSYKYKLIKNSAVYVNLDNIKTAENDTI